MHVDRRNNRISDTSIFSPLLGRHSKYAALRGYDFCVDTQISDGLARQGQLVTGSKKDPVFIDKHIITELQIVTNVRFREA